MSNQTINTLPSSTSTFLTTAQTFWRDELPAVLTRLLHSGYIYSGGLHATAAGMTSASFSTEAFTPLGVRLTADGASGAVAINYTTQGAAAADTVWVIISNRTGSSIAATNFTRVGSSNLFTDAVSSSQPTLPSDSCWLMQVTISGSAITAVQDLRVPASYARLGMYDVTDPLYGAVHDSTLTTSDRTAIQQCFNAACSPTGNKTVLFPAGTYFLGTNGTTTKILDLSALGDGITIRTHGFVELVNTAQTGDHLPRIFYLSNNSDFTCEPIAFRDTNYDSTDALAASGANQGAIGFYIQNQTVTQWGRLYFARIYATTMTSGLICARATGGTASYTARVRDIYVGQLIANDTYYGLNFQDDGDHLFVGDLYANQCRRAYYVYGVSHHKVNVMDINPRGSTGKCYIARQVAGLNTTDIKVNYASRKCNQAGTTLVAIDHIDLLGGEISGITVDVDVKESVASYLPVKFRNYSAGVESAAASLNYTRDIRLSGSCDANALACTTTTNISYADKRQLHFVPGYNFLPNNTYLLKAFQLNQLARSQTDLTWTGSGGNPSLGNGTLTYDIDISSGMLFLNIKLTIGSTTTTGTGSWAFSGFAPALVAASDAVGTVLCIDTGVKYYTGLCKITRNGGNIGVYVDNNSNGIGPTIPFTWANGDQLFASIAFPVSALD